MDKAKMRWLNNTNDAADTHLFRHDQDDTLICPSCAHPIHFQLLQGGFEGFPLGVKFDPNDEEILKHLEAKVKGDKRKLHPLIDQFIPTLDGDDGICYTHPQNLPGMRKDGEMRHFFHRASKAYTAGTRKRRKVQTEEQGTDIRWHKTGKTRPVIAGGVVIGFKKILVLYSNYGSQSQQKPQKTNWIMHQYHLGLTEHEKDGQFVASKVFFQKHPRQTSSSSIQQCGGGHGGDWPQTAAVFVDYGNPIMSSMYDIGGFGSVLGQGTHSTDSTRHTSF